jgi:hypothetical protein
MEDDDGMTKPILLLHSFMKDSISLAAKENWPARAHRIASHRTKQQRLVAGIVPRIELSGRRSSTRRVLVFHSACCCSINRNDDVDRLPLSLVALVYSCTCPQLLQQRRWAQQQRQYYVENLLGQQVG